MGRDGLLSTRTVLAGCLAGAGRDTGFGRGVDAGFCSMVLCGTAGTALGLCSPVLGGVLRTGAEALLCAGAVGRGPALVGLGAIVLTGPWFAGAACVGWLITRVGVFPLAGAGLLVAELLPTVGL